MRTSPANPAQPAPFTHTSLFLITTFVAYFYVLIEWVFIVTKPSYLNNWSWLKKLELYFFTGGLFTAVCFLPLIALFLIGRLPGLQKLRLPLARLARLAPVLVFAALALMLLDNFTYTVIKFGIVSSRGLARGLYALLFIGFTVQFYRVIGRDLGRLSGRLAHHPAGRWVLPGVVALVLASFVLPLAANERGPGATDLTAGYALRTRPNVLYITSDGVDATHMSLYGYARDTTPYLNQLAAASLVAENVYTNVSKTSGSTISALTGRYPADTRVLIQPDILRGQAAYLHLPGIFRSAGYRTAQFSYPYYVDAYALNVLNGFDSANGRSFNKDGLVSRLISFGPTHFAYFLLDTSTRLLDRLGHIFYLKAMANPYDLVARDDQALDGRLQINDLYALLETTDRPFFVHMHLLGTHGPRFHVRKQVFSQGTDPLYAAPYDMDVYDDSILEFDRNIQEIVDRLTALGLFDNTILIVGSDHGMEYTPYKRIPLLIHFPNGAHAGKITSNVQILDIAPTVLDYLGVQPPAWMEGRSLLQNPLPERPIFVIDSARTDENDSAFWSNRPQLLTPPFYQFGSLTTIHCDQWYMLNLTDGGLTRGAVVGSTAVCPQGLPPDDQIYAEMVAHLQAYGFDTATLEAAATAHFKPTAPAQ